MTERHTLPKMATEPRICKRTDCVKNRWGECRREGSGKLEPGQILVNCDAYERNDELKARIEAREARDDYRQMVRMGEYQ